MFQALSFELRYLLMGTLAIGIVLSSSYTIVKDFRHKREAAVKEQSLKAKHDEFQALLSSINKSIKKSQTITALFLWATF